MTKIHLCVIILTVVKFCPCMVKMCEFPGVPDFAGGAPELCEQFRFLVSGGRKLGKNVIVRSNLTSHLEPG